MTQPLLYTPTVVGLAPYNPYGKRKRLLVHVREVLETYSSLLSLEAMKSLDFSRLR